MGRYKKLNQIALPLILQSISGLVIGLCDQMMIGRISVEAYGAVGVISSLLYLIAGMLGVSSVTFNIKASSAIGSHAYEDYEDELMSVLILNMSIGFIVGLLVFISGQYILYGMYGFEGDVLKEASKYFLLMSPYLLIQLLLFVFSANFKVKRKTKYILYGATSASVMNVVLNYVLIYGKFGMPKLGIRGAAVGTILSLSLNLVYYYFLCRKDLRFSLEKIKLYKSKMRTNILYSLPLIGEEFIDGFLFVTAINMVIARLDLVSLSAYLILSQILSIMLMPSYMYGSALLSLMSENKSKGTFDLLNGLSVDANKLALLFYCTIGMVVVAFHDWVPRIITDDVEVISLAGHFMIMMVLLSISKVTLTIYKSALQAVDCAIYILKWTVIINIIALGILFCITQYNQLNLQFIYVVLGGYYLSLTLIFRFKFRHKCQQISLKNKESFKPPMV